MSDLDEVKVFTVLLFLLCAFWSYIIGASVTRDGDLNKFCEYEYSAEFHQIDDREFCLTEDNELISIDWFDTND